MEHCIGVLMFLEKDSLLRSFACAILTTSNHGSFFSRPHSSQTWGLQCLFKCPAHCSWCYNPQPQEKSFFHQHQRKLRSRWRCKRWHGATRYFLAQGVEGNQILGQAFFYNFTWYLRRGKILPYLEFFAWVLSFCLSFKYFPFKFSKSVNIFGRKRWNLNFLFINIA